MSFFGELRRRNVVKVAVAYAIVGWLMVQIADVFLIALRLPEWTVTFFAALLVLGFPIALFLSWAYELTPAGMKKTQSVPLSQSISKITGRQLDFVIMALMAAGIVFLVVDNYVLDTSGPFAGAEIDPASLDPSLDEPPTPAPTGGVAVDREVLPNSVAVLPLENLSPDPDNAYFAAGMHEEILNQLVKLRNLNVISRTSVLQYAEDRPSIPEIARELNVQAVMEGSVRFDGERVLVQAQLIDAATDSHLWSAGYEREFAGVFAIQSDIAMNIANALEAEFSLAEQQSIEKIPTVSPEAYAWYLRALARAGNRMADVSRALEIDPNFAAAYAFRAWLHAGRVTFSEDVDTAEEERLALEDAERALALDPTLGLAHVALANVHEIYWRWEEAREAYERAYELSPTTAEVLTQYGRFMRNTGDYPEAIRVGTRAVELDPLNQSANNQLGVTYRFARDNDAATDAYFLLATLAAAPSAHLSLGVVEATRGNDQEAISNLRRAEELFGDNITQIFRYAHFAMGYSLAGEREEAERFFAALEERAQESPVGESVWALAYIALGDYDEAFRRLEAAMAAPSSASYVTLIEIKANPWVDPVLDEPRFKEVLADLWSE